MNDTTILPSSTPPFDPPETAVAPVPKGKKQSATALAIKQINGIQASFEKAQAEIAALVKKHTGVVYDVSTTKGIEEAKAARAEVRQVRYNIQNAVDAGKAPLNALKADIAARGKELIGMLQPVEDELDAPIRKEEERKAAEKVERERKAAAERLRIDGAISHLRDSAITAMGKSSEFIAHSMDQLRDYDVTLEEFGERAGDAEQVKSKVLEQLELMLETAKQQEVQAQVLKDQQEELRRQRAEEEERVAQARREEAARLEDARNKMLAEAAALAKQRVELAAERKLIEDAQATERRRVEEQERQQRAEAERVDRERMDAEAAQKRRVGVALMTLCGKMIEYGDTLEHVDEGLELVQGWGNPSLFDLPDWGGRDGEVEATLTDIRTALQMRRASLVAEAEKKAAEDQAAAAEEQAAAERLSRLNASTRLHQNAEELLERSSELVAAAHEILDAGEPETTSYARISAALMALDSLIKTIKE